LIALEPRSASSFQINQFSMGEVDMLCSEKLVVKHLRFPAIAILLKAGEVDVGEFGPDETLYVAAV
jgi:hypothetical protein